MHQSEISNRYKIFFTIANNAIINNNAMRLKWAEENIDRDQSNVVFTDEVSVWGHITTSRAWSKSGNRLLQRSIKHHVKVHLWGCFSKHGFGKLYLFTYNLNAEKMLEIYKNALVPSAKRWYTEKNED